MAKMTPLIAHKTILPPQLQQIATALGLPHIGGLQSRPDLIPAAVKVVDELVAAGGAM